MSPPSTAEVETSHPADTSPEPQAGCSSQQGGHKIAVDGQPQELPGSLSWRLWSDNKQLALRSLHHPFVQGLATGALSRGAFQHYLKQGYVYMQYYAEAYKLALPKCEGHPPVVREAVQGFLAGVEQELQLHLGYAASWGVDLTNASASPTTIAYTDFLMEVAKSDQGVDALFAAMAPCARLYGFLGCQLVASHPQWQASPYARWIETYGGAEFLAMPALKERLLDGMAGRTEYATLSQLYSRAMQLEYDFFNAQLLE